MQSSSKPASSVKHLVMPLSKRVILLRQDQLQGYYGPAPFPEYHKLTQKLSEHKPRLNRYYHQMDPTHFQSPKTNCQPVPALHHNSSEEMAPSALSLPRYKPRTMHRKVILLNCAPCLYFSSSEYHTLCLNTWRAWHNVHPAWRWISIPTATHETGMTRLTNVLEETSPLLSGKLMYIHIYGVMPKNQYRTFSLN